MRSLVLTLGPDDPATALGTIAATNLAGPGGRILVHKGERLDAEAVAALADLAAAAPGTRVSLLRLDGDDVDEREAARLLAAALAGPGVAARPPAQGRCRLVAAHAGLLCVDGAALAAANAVPDVSIYTLFDGTPVAEGTLLAEAKVTPLVAPRARVAEAAAILRGSAESSALAVRPFQPHRAGLLIRERLAPAATARLAGVLRGKLAWFGSTLAESDVRYTGDSPASVAAGLRGLLDAGVTLLLTAGGSTSDPADATLTALPGLGATLLRRGVPIHPGSLLWLAARDATLIVGVPSCGAFSGQTSLDLLLPRLLALGPAGAAGLEHLAAGGLLTRGMDHRFPPYPDVTAD